MLLACLFSLHPAHAAQYIRDQWGPDKGFPSGPVYAITQTADGYLWVGAEAGLVRFDGLAFKLMQTADRPPFSLAQVLGLTAADDGSLWIRLRGLNLLRYRDGAFDSISPRLSEARVTVVIRSGDSELISSTRAGVLLSRGSRLESLLPPESMLRSPVISLARSPGGDIWMGTRDQGLARVHGGNLTVIAAGLPSLKINSLIAQSDDRVWIGTDNGIALWDGKQLARGPSSLEHVPAIAMILGRDGTVWAGTARGLFSIDMAGLATLVEPGAVTAVFEDREGNLWIAGADRLERLRRGSFTTWSKQDGLPSDSVGPLYADAENVWFAPETGGLSSLLGGKITPLATAGLDRDVVYSIAGRGPDLWIGRQHGGLTHLRPGDPAKTYTHADGLAQDSVFAVNLNRDGSVWAGTLNGGASRLRDGRFTTYTKANGLASDTIYAILESSDGTIWFATPGGLSSFTRAGWRTYTTADGLPSENVSTLFEDSAGTLWIGTLHGLAWFRSGRIQVPNAAQPPLHEQILGIAEEPHGALWFTTGNHVVRVLPDRFQMDRLQRGPVRDEDLRPFDLADGLRSVSGVRRHRSVISDQRGNIWIATLGGLSVVHAANTNSSPPAIVHIQGLSVDGNSIPLHDPLRIPGGHQRITLDYAGLSLGIPERTRFRYMLENFDHGWSRPVAEREAAYTNLGPGKYRFRVVSSNLDQVFNSAEATLAFEIEPLFWQTWWFRLLSLLLFAVSVVVFIRSRMLRLTRQMNLRFEERLAERTRIAQELHDTLLQGFISASMQLDVATDRVPDDSPVKQLLKKILELMSRVTREGRDALRDLRSSSGAFPGDSSSLEQAFSHVQQEFAHQDIQFRVIMEGKPRPLHPVLRDEVYRIGREALGNAFRHSHATNIEVELEYAPKRFRVLVRDNGCGIDPLVLRAGREGHWGLPGMRERAERIGARLRLWSRADSGTEVELSVPGNVAFKSGPRPRWSYWFFGK